MLNVIVKNVRALSAYGQPVHTWDTLLIAIIVSKFDFKLNDIEFPTFEQLIITFIDKDFRGDNRIARKV